MPRRNASGTSRRGFLAMTAGVASAAGTLANETQVAAATTIGGPAIPIEGKLRGRLAAAPRGAIAPARLDSSIDIAIENLTREGFTDLFPDQFETVLLESPELRNRLRGRLRARFEDWHVDEAAIAPVELLSLPKRTPFGIRRAAILRPSDAVLYLALAILAAPRIEACRLPKAEMRIFSYRYAPLAASLFDHNFTYASFVERANECLLANRAGVVATADIEAFYERIPPERVRKSLQACGVDLAVVARITDLLEFWQEGGGIGLPIGSNASRILAEAVLQPVDRRLAESGVAFLRFVDDYRFFAPNIETAQAWLSLLAQNVEEIGLTLSEQKTTLDAVADVLTTGPSLDEVIFAEDTSQIPPPTRDPRNPTPRPKAPPVPRTKPKGPPPDLTHRLRYDPSPPEYKAPPTEKHGELQRTDLKALRAALLDGVEIRSNALVRLYIDAALAQRSDEAIGSFPQVIARYLQFSGYCASALIVAGQDLDSTLCDRLAGDFERLLAAVPSVRDHIRIAVIRLLGSPAFARAETIASLVRQLGDQRAGYLARVSIESLRQVATESVLLELIGLYDSFGEWAKRSILAWAIERRLDDRLRDAVSASGDLFAQAMLQRLATV